MNKEDELIEMMKLLLDATEIKDLKSTSMNLEREVKRKNHISTLGD